MKKTSEHKLVVSLKKNVQDSIEQLKEIVGNISLFSDIDRDRSSIKYGIAAGACNLGMNSFKFVKTWPVFFRFALPTVIVSYLVASRNLKICDIYDDLKICRDDYTYETNLLKSEQAKKEEILEQKRKDLEDQLTQALELLSPSNREKVAKSRR